MNIRARLQEGGEGSGFYGHAGREGARGGSSKVGTPGERTRLANKVRDIRASGDRKRFSSVRHRAGQALSIGKYNIGVRHAERGAAGTNPHGAKIGKIARRTKEILQRKGVHPDELGYSKRTGELTFRKGFFYTHGGSAEKYAGAIKKVFPGAKITGTGDIWKPFKGGGSLKTQSHFQVRFKFPGRKK